MIPHRPGVRGSSLTQDEDGAVRELMLLRVHQWRLSKGLALRRSDPLDPRSNQPPTLAGEPRVVGTLSSPWSSGQNELVLVASAPGVKVQLVQWHYY